MGIIRWPAFRGTGVRSEPGKELGIMKNALVSVFLNGRVLFLFCLCGQITLPIAAPRSEQQSATWQAVARDANSITSEKPETVTNPFTGQTERNTRRYIELGTGRNSQ